MLFIAIKSRSSYLSASLPSFFHPQIKSQTMITFSHFCHIIHLQSKQMRKKETAPSQMKTSKHLHFTENKVSGSIYAFNAKCTYNLTQFKMDVYFFCILWVLALCVCLGPGYGLPKQYYFLCQHNFLANFKAIFKYASLSKGLDDVVRRMCALQSRFFSVIKCSLLSIHRSRIPLNFDGAEKWK